MTAHGPERDGDGMAPVIVHRATGASVRTITPADDAFTDAIRDYVHFAANPDPDVRAAYITWFEASVTAAVAS